MVDKNLFPYNLAIVAIFKNESPYLGEWLDYHLLAGVEHFYLYNNESSDNFAEVLKPYVDAGIVTVIDWPGKIMQMPAYNDALERFRFFCRYIAFVDLDEFILPKTGQSIVEVVDDVLSRDGQSAALAINWQIFGSNGCERADLSRGVLERFTRRAPTDWSPAKGEDIFGGTVEKPLGNFLIKTLANPRATSHFYNPHFAVYFGGFRAVNENGRPVGKFFNAPITVARIAVNHYYTRSREEYAMKFKRGRSDIDGGYASGWFDIYDRNEVFDDDILTYRASRAKSFSLTDEAQRFNRVEKFLVDTLTAKSPFNVPPEFFAGKLETFLTCRKLAQVLDVRIGNRSAEEFALVWIYQLLNTDGALTYADLQLFLDEVPEILSRPLPTARKVMQTFQERVLPSMAELAKFGRPWKELKDIKYLQRMLNLILR